MSSAKLSNTKDTISTPTSENLLTALIKRIEESSANLEKGKFTYIIGNNGSGKSRALSALSEILHGNSKFPLVACIASSIHDRFNYESTGNIRYMGARNISNAVFISSIERDLTGYILQAMLIKRGAFKTLCNSVGLEISFSLDQRSIRYLQLDYKPKTRNAMRLRKKAEELNLITARSISVLNRIANEKTSFDQLTAAQIAKLKDYVDANIDINLEIKDLQGRSMGFDGLSTGEQNRLLMLAKILSAMKEHTVFLIDEPELSLHLHWQMEFHSTLLKILSSLKNYHVVIATHSPIMISEAVRADRTLDNVVVVLGIKTIEKMKSFSTEENQIIPLRFYSFVDVASHEQLVLRQFHTSPYQTREVSVEITNTVLNYAEGTIEKSAALASLEELTIAEGLSQESEIQIRAAIAFVRKGLTKSIKDTISK